MAAASPGGSELRVFAHSSLPFTDLPTDVLGFILYRLLLAHQIAAVAPTCRALHAAVLRALKARPFSSEVVTLSSPGIDIDVQCVAAASDGRIITVSDDERVKLWRDGVCVAITLFNVNDGAVLRTFKHDHVHCLALLPDGLRFVSGGSGHTCLLYTSPSPRDS